MYIQDRTVLDNVSNEELMHEVLSPGGVYVKNTEH